MIGRRVKRSKRGGVELNSHQVVEGEAKIALLDRDGEMLTIAGREESVLLVLNGEPIDEPVASYGPFVMNTREEIMQAVEDLKAGKFGRL